MLHTTTLINNKLYIPAEQFKNIIKSAGLSMQILNIDKNKIIFQMNIYNIYDYYIDKKHNGLEISYQNIKT